jgi:hypothetical protein
MENDLHETHVGERLVVAHESASDALHSVAAVVAEFSFRIPFLKGFHEVGSVKVSTGFSCDEVVFHLLKSI